MRAPDENAKAGFDRFTVIIPNHHRLSWDGRVDKVRSWPESLQRAFVSPGLHSPTGNSEGYDRSSRYRTPRRLNTELVAPVQRQRRSGRAKGNVVLRMCMRTWSADQTSHMSTGLIDEWSKCVVNVLAARQEPEVYGRKSPIAVTSKHEVDYRNMSTEELTERLAKGLALSNLLPISLKQQSASVGMGL